MTDYKVLCAELLKALSEWALGQGSNVDAHLIIRARTALAQPEPEGAGLSDEEVLDLADDCGLEKQDITTWDGESRTVDHGWECTDAQLVTFATALIARYARPTIKSVPVTERPWEREGWSDAEGRCWWWCHRHESWELDDGPAHYRHCLPHNALPIPTP